MKASKKKASSRSAHATARKATSKNVAKKKADGFRRLSSHRTSSNRHVLPNRQMDRQKTKIIATIGNPSIPGSKAGDADETTYKDGVVDLNHEVIEKVTILNLVELFDKARVDVIRMNFAHVKLKHVRVVFLAVKNALLAVDKKAGRRMGLLADLPGPKIRFKSSHWILPTKELRISFHRVDEQLKFLSKRERKGNKTPVRQPSRGTACIAMGSKYFAEAAPDATKKILTELKRQLRENGAITAFIGDDDAILEVQDVQDELIICKIRTSKRKVIGGDKGFTLRGIHTDVPAFTEEDQKKLSLLIQADYEGFTPRRDTRVLSHVGLSFCQSRDDARRALNHIVDELRKTPAFRKKSFASVIDAAPMLIAKIETRSGVMKIDDILDIADGAMVARGDLALQLDTVDLPAESKRIISSCNMRGKPVIMATQMLESMKTSIECTRPEASDVFNAVIDGADALMLSGETSSGRYPGLVVTKMRSIATNAETFSIIANADDADAERAEANRIASEPDNIHDYFRKLERFALRVKSWHSRWRDIVADYSARLDTEDESATSFVVNLSQLKMIRLMRQDATDRISHAACIMSAEPGIGGIVAPTKSGRTARMLARFRPRVWIIAHAHDRLTSRKLRIVRGIAIGAEIRVDPKNSDVIDLMNIARKHVEREFKPGPFVFTFGLPLGEVGSTNVIQRWTIGGPEF